MLESMLNGFLKIVICDDDINFLKMLKEIIRKELQKHGINEFEFKSFHSGKELCEEETIIKEYNVFFLDINMPEISGMDIAKKIRKENRAALLIFITAFNDYAVEGYKVEAIRYIVKDMIDKYMPECIEAVIEKCKLKTFSKEYQFVEGVRRLLVASIEHIESSKHRLIFYIKNKDGSTEKLTMYETLDLIQDDLKDYGFIRIHKSYLVNMRSIKDIFRYSVILRTDIELPIPKEKYPSLRKEYYEYVGNCYD